MLKSLKKKLNPQWYQGASFKPPFFEGWYFKLTDSSNSQLYAIIPGVFVDNNSMETHSFVQVFDGGSNKTHYFRFPINEFRAAEEKFEIQIESNFFTERQIFLNLKNDVFEMSGTLKFSNLIPWPSTFISPGIMGWYSWVPFMECYHGIVSMQHRISGHLMIDGQKVDFSNGKGYSEKDWGRSFPKAWIWCQSNHFSDENTSFTGSLAIIPWIRRPFLGLIFGLWHNQRLYRFATYLGAKIVSLEINDKMVYMVIKQKNSILRVRATRPESGILHAPTLRGMTHRIYESLKSEIEIELLQVSNKAEKSIYRDTGIHGGLEVAGDLKQLIKMYQNEVKKKLI